ncbi:MAG: flagellar biosynthetic protein FliO [Planctomycetaceae bacterium]
MWRTRSVSRGLLTLALLLVCTGAARSDDDGPDERASAPERLAAPAHLDLEPMPPRDQPPRTASGSRATSWPWQVAAFLATLAAAVALLRGIGPRPDRSATSATLALEGTLALGPQHGLRLVRFGRRILLIGLAPGGCSLIAEGDESLGEGIATATPGVEPTRGPLGAPPDDPDRSTTPAGMPRAPAPTTVADHAPPSRGAA